ncbi:hypothetical protein GKODMF_04090 [Candidatus Electrothrix gigas]
MRRNKPGWTALMVAAKKGNVHIVHILLNNNANVGIKKKSFNFDTRQGVPYIFGGGWGPVYLKNVKFSRESALMLAAKNNHTEIVTALMKAGADDIPNFPFPPPNASAFAKIPSTFLLNPESEQQTSLQNAAKKLEAAFDKTGYSQKKYYQVPNGFALVSQLEQFRSDGSSKQEPDRWAAEFRPPRIFSLTSYIKAIFKANPGRYRIVAFIVTSQPFEEGKERITREEARSWLDSGMVVLPKSIGEQPYTDEHYCTALIYEFELPENGKKALFKTSSNLTGRDHLQKSNLWTALQQ